MSFQWLVSTDSTWLASAGANIMTEDELYSVNGGTCECVDFREYGGASVNEMSTLGAVSDVVSTMVSNGEKLQSPKTRKNYK